MEEKKTLQIKMFSWNLVSCTCYTQELIWLIRMTMSNVIIAKRVNCSHKMLHCFTWYTWEFIRMTILMLFSPIIKGSSVMCQLWILVWICLCNTALIFNHFAFSTSFCATPYMVNNKVPMKRAHLMTLWISNQCHYHECQFHVDLMYMCLSISLLVSCQSTEYATLFVMERHFIINKSTYIPHLLGASTCTTLDLIIHHEHRGHCTL